MKNIIILIFLTFILSLKPSFACGCGDELSSSHQIMSWIVMGVVFLIYLIPSLYFAKYFRKYQLSIEHLILSHVLMIAMLYAMMNSFKLGLNPIYYWFADYLPNSFIFAAIGFIGVLVWIYPVIYVAKRAK
ncbi:MULTISPECIES: hypothetical protein [Acinetobacter]|nr:MULTISPECIES: hypothetical protein [Acinetobacter]KQW90509.1 hypothetical protein ASC84_09285 [Acinetobacter sp. Root1280]